MTRQHIDVALEPRLVPQLFLQRQKNCDIRIDTVGIDKRLGDRARLRSLGDVEIRDEGGRGRQDHDDFPYKVPDGAIHEAIHETLEQLVTNVTMVHNNEREEAV